MAKRTAYYDIHVEQKLVKKNRFISMSMSDTPIPSLEEFLKKIPKLSWPRNSVEMDCYRYAWNRAYLSLKPANKHFHKPFIDTCFNGHIFLWDSAFMMQFGKYGESAFPFFGTLDDLYEHQHADGFICREIEQSTGYDRFERFDLSSTGPNVLAWVEWDRYLLHKDMDRLKNVFPVICSYHRWLRQYRTWKDGTYFTSGWGSGMDNLPRQSQEYHPEFSHGHLSWIDATAQQALSCEMIINIANVIQERDIDDFVTEHALLKTHIQSMWDEKTKFFYDSDKWNHPTGVMTVGSYWVMMAGLATKEQAQAMVDHLLNPKDFFSLMVVPGLALNHPQCDDIYWRGGVWAPTTYMVFKALDRYGFHKEKFLLAKRYLDAIWKDYQKTGKLYEVYESKTGIHQNIAREHFVGWTGLAPITIVIEDIFGIKINLSTHQIDWHIFLDEPFSIECIPFGAGKVSFFFDPNPSLLLTDQVRCVSTEPMTLRVFYHEEVKVFPVGN